MAKATDAYTASDAAREIHRLINERPSLPHPQEIEAIITRVAATPNAESDDALIACGSLTDIERWEQAEKQWLFNVSAIAARKNGSRDDAYEEADAKITDLSRSIWEKRARSWADIVLRAKVAKHWKWAPQDNLDEEEFADLLRVDSEGTYDQRGIAQLVHAVLELHQITQARVAVENAGDLTTIDFEPVTRPDGSPIEFDYSNMEFANVYLPTVRIALNVIGQSKEELHSVAGAMSEGGVDVLELLERIDDVYCKFDAVAGFAKAAWARLCIVAELQEDDRIKQHAIAEVVS